MKFGVGFPTAMEGMMYPVPFAGAAELRDIAQAAEDLGFHGIWANDHLSTQQYVRDEFPDPPNFFDPLSSLAFVAGVTSRLRLATGILVLPFRHPVVAAKQLATLDQLSDGRLIVGVGIGAYREEFQALHPNMKLHRGQYAEESLLAFRELFSRRRATYDGRWISFADVESYPKPVQDPLPILSGGNSAGSKDRAGRLAQGWMPACLTPLEIQEGREAIQGAAAGAGRDLPQDFSIALQVGVRVGDTREQAAAEFEASQVRTHIVSLTASTLKNQDVSNVLDRSLVGSADQLHEQIRRYIDVGVTNLAGLLFAATGVNDFIAQMERFSDEVMSEFSSETEFE